jgi:alpha-beta hydrolase superfamily lysophospholipase
VPRPTFLTADRVVLAGRRWLADSEPDGAVVLVHGFTASADCPHVGRVATALHALNLDVVTYDARGHGRSGGESTLGDLERHDVAAGVAASRERTDRVVLVGASMGAIAVLRHAAVDHDLAGVVSISAPSQWRVPRTARAALAVGMTRTPIGRMAMTRLTGVRIARRWTNPTPPVELVRAIRSPLAIVHGTADRFIPASDARELWAAAREPRRLALVPHMGHAFDPVGLGEVVASVAWAFDQAPAPASADAP